MQGRRVEKGGSRNRAAEVEGVVGVRIRNQPVEDLVELRGDLRDEWGERTRMIFIANPW